MTYKLDLRKSRLSKISAIQVPGNPGPLCLNKDETVLYAGLRTGNAISSFRINKQTGRLTFLNTVPAPDNAVFLTPDRTGRFLLAVYYNCGKASTFAITKNGALRDSSIQVITGFVNPHAIMAAPDNKVVYITDKSGDRIFSYDFDENTGHLSPRVIPYYQTQKGIQPRHLAFLNEKNLLYVVNEESNSLSTYACCTVDSLLCLLNQVPTIPTDFYGLSKCADIHLSPDNKFLYLSNRGHNSIAVYRLDELTGLPHFMNWYTTIPNPRTFALDAAGRFLITAGESSNKIQLFRRNPKSGALHSVQILDTGEMPSWISILKPVE